MKVVIAAQRKDPPKNQGFMRAPISLERPTEKEAKDGDFASFKLRSNPEDANSPLHEIKVQYWKGGTAEEWFLFQRDLERVLKGQNVTYAKDAYAITRGLLKGEFLTRFNVKALQLQAKHQCDHQLHSTKEGTCGTKTLFTPSCSKTTKYEHEGICCPLQGDQ